jgi:hypothetical protein
MGDSRIRLRSFAELSQVRSGFTSAPTNIPNIKGVVTKETFRDVQSIPMTEIELERWKGRKGRINWNKWR